MRGRRERCVEDALHRCVEGACTQSVVGPCCGKCLVKCLPTASLRLESGSRSRGPAAQCISPSWNSPYGIWIWISRPRAPACET
jgi:hypothetical protein